MTKASLRSDILNNMSRPVTMKPRASSSVHFQTASLPSIAVQCHRPSSKLAVQKHVVGDTFLRTNDFLKKGGSLPLVFPTCGSGDLNDKHTSKSQNIIYHSETTANMFSKQNTRSKKFEKTLEPETLSKSKLSQDLETHTNVNELEKRMEHLSCKLAKVQDILMDQMTKDGEPTPRCSAKESNGFSAKDYQFFIFELNGDVTVKLYDPEEFRDKNEM